MQPSLPRPERRPRLLLPHSCFHGSQMVGGWYTVDGRGPHKGRDVKATATGQAALLPGSWLPCPLPVLSLFPGLRPPSLPFLSLSSLLLPCSVAYTRTPFPSTLPRSFGCCLSPTRSQAEPELPAGRAKPSSGSRPQGRVGRAGLRDGSGW